MRKAVLSHDTTRPITAAINRGKGDWQMISDPAFMHVDVEGTNYLPRLYEPDHVRHPERIMMCTESFPKDAFFCWSEVERLPYVIGDFVWSGFDYLGEAGLGRSWLSGEPHDQINSWPRHIAGSGDIDILGRRKPWSHYREALWRPGVLHVTVHQPLPSGKTEAISLWGWKDVRQHDAGSQHRGSAAGQDRDRNTMKRR